MTKKRGIFIRGSRVDWHEEAEANSEDLRPIRGALF
jgi:hypothetical protein